jgi:hypothetical protein
MRRAIWIAIALCAACAGRRYYAYDPAEGVAYRGYDGRIGSERRLPDGDVRVVAMGLADVYSRHDGTPGFRALHVRMILDNKSGSAWRLRADEQRALIDRWGPSFPAEAAIGNNRVGAVIVPAGKKLAIDLFYPTPMPAYGEVLPPGFSVDWRVRVPEGEIGERVRFERRMMDAREAATRLNRL